MEFDNKKYRLTKSGNIGKVSLIIGVSGLVLSAVAYFIDSRQFFHSYLVAFTFWTSIGLGGLFFIMMHYLTNATWSVVIRRLSENIMMVLPFMAVFTLPILFGMGELYDWSHADVVQADKLLAGKSGYLNVPFFVIRIILYFAVWTFLGRYLYKLSLKQDAGHNDSLTTKATRISAPGMILFAVTITFASFDLLMSLDAHWYSTIFGVYIFSGSFLGFLCFVTLIIIMFRKNGILEQSITFEHFHDLGKLIFAFVIFWAYMAFSQYFLIWYGNIPEETIWFLHRWEGSWKIITLIIVFGHFVVPFFTLIPMAAKRNMTVMKVMGLWILLMHWMDIYWIVMPSLHHHGVHLSWMDISTFAGIGGMFIWLFWRRICSSSLVPINDPRLQKSIEIVS